jgi:hypothetical protein
MTEITKPTEGEVKQYGKRGRGVGLGMPGGLPRTKKTSKQQRHIYDVLTALAEGKLNAPVYNEGELVTIDARREYGYSISVSKFFFENFFNDYGNTSNVLVRIRDSDTGVFYVPTIKNWR